MKIRLLSDLHLEFAEFELDTSDIDVIVLAGDIHVGTKAIDWLKKYNLEVPIIYVAGNHEFYSQKYPGLINAMKQMSSVLKNVYFLENDSISLDGVRFHGCTLWTDFALLGEPQIAGFYCQQNMNDYKKIRREPSYSKIRSIDIAAIHQKSKQWLSESLTRSTERTNVVITHHAPSPRSIEEIYRDDLLSAAYASNLTSFIDEHRPQFWLHGHLHSSADYMEGATRVICNPRGYKHELNDRFDPAFSLTI